MVTSVFLTLSLASLKTAAQSSSMAPPSLSRMRLSCQSIASGMQTVAAEMGVAVCWQLPITTMASAIRSTVRPFLSSARKNFLMPLLHLKAAISGARPTSFCLRTCKVAKRLLSTGFGTGLPCQAPQDCPRASKKSTRRAWTSTFRQARISKACKMPSHSNLFSKILAMPPCLLS